MSASPYSRTTIETQLLCGNVFKTTLGMSIEPGALGHFIMRPPSTNQYSCVLLCREFVSTNTEGWDYTEYGDMNFDYMEPPNEVINMNRQKDNYSEFELREVKTLISTASPYRETIIPGATGSYKDEGATVLADRPVFMSLKNLAPYARRVYITYKWIQISVPEDL